MFYCSIFFYFTDNVKTHTIHLFALKCLTGILYEVGQVHSKNALWGKIGAKY